MTTVGKGIAAGGSAMPYSFVIPKRGSIARGICCVRGGEGW
jgi:hypothetical protein